MAASPRYKVYSAEGEYVAACKYAEDAAVLVSARGPGANVRLEHAKRFTVWTEGEDGEAGESYGAAASTMWEREESWRTDTCDSPYRRKYGRK